MRSRPGRSTAPSPSRPGGPRRLDVHLFPAVVGGGLGDIEETLAAGRRLAGAGWVARLYRRSRPPTSPGGGGTLGLAVASRTRGPTRPACPRGPHGRPCVGCQRRPRPRRCDGSPRRVGRGSGRHRAGLRERLDRAREPGGVCPDPLGGAREPGAAAGGRHPGPGAARPTPPVSSGRGSRPVPRGVRALPRFRPYEPPPPVRDLPAGTRFSRPNSRRRCRQAPYGPTASGRPSQRGDGRAIPSGSGMGAPRAPNGSRPRSSAASRRSTRRSGSWSGPPVPGRSLSQEGSSRYGAARSPPASGGPGSRRRPCGW